MCLLKKMYVSFQKFLKQTQEHKTHKKCVFMQDTLHENCLFVSFNIVNMFPSIDSKMGIKSVMNNVLLNRDDNIPSECIVEALELDLNCNISISNNQHYLQVDGVVQGRICPAHTVTLQCTPTIL